MCIPTLREASMFPKAIIVYLVTHIYMTDTEPSTNDVRKEEN